MQFVYQTINNIYEQNIHELNFWKAEHHFKTNET